MVRKVLICIGNGVEETEALIPLSVLRKVGIEVCLASVGVTGSELNNNEPITGVQNIRIMPDCTIEKCASEKWDVIIVPGGEKFIQLLGLNETFLEMMKNQITSDRWLACICSGVLLLQQNKLAFGRRVTTHSKLKSSLTDLKWCDERVCVDGNLITSQAPGTAFEFTLTILKQLEGSSKATQLCEDLRVRCQTNEL